MRGLPQRVEFRQPPDVVDQCVVLTGTGVDGVDLPEPELQPVGLLRHFPCPLGSFGEIAASRLPRVADLAIALQQRTDVCEAVKRGALFVSAHEAQLVVLPVQGEQLGGERAQRLRGHTAAAEVGPGGPVAADRSRGDHTAVFVAIGAGGVQNLIDLGGHPVTEVAGAEPALDHGAGRPGPNPGRVGPCAAEQMQSGHHHRLARAGLAGQHGQPAVEFGGRRADRAQRLDADLGEHYCPRQPVTGSRNLRTRRSVNGALSRRTHFSGVPHRVTSSRPPAGTTISRRPSQNTSAS